MYVAAVSCHRLVTACLSTSSWLPMLVGCSDWRAFSFNAWFTRVWYSPLNAYFRCVWSRSIFDGTESSVLVGVYSGLPIAAGWGV